MKLSVKDERNILKLVRAVVENDVVDITEVTDFDDLIQAATNSVDYGDISEFCREVGIDEEWFDTYFEYDAILEDYCAKWKTKPKDIEAQAEDREW